MKLPVEFSLWGGCKALQKGNCRSVLDFGSLEGVIDHWTAFD